MKIKRYIMLFASSLLTAAAIFSVGEYMKSTTPTVDIFCVSKTKSDEIVQSTGKVGYINQKNIKSTYDCVVSEVFVNENDIIKKGDKLFKVATVQIPTTINMNNISELIDIYKNYDMSKAEYKIITAPQGGTVTSIKIKNGELSKKGSELLTITDKSGLSVELNINEAQISKIKKGQKVTITGTAFDQKIYIGSIFSIANEAEETNSETGRETTVSVGVKIENPDKEIKCGYTAKCSIIVSSDKNAVIIPYEALGSDSNGDYVYKFNNGRAEKEYIIIENEISEGAKIKKGINDGDKIIKDISELSDRNIQAIHIEDEV